MNPEEKLAAARSLTKFVAGTCVKTVIATTIAAYVPAADTKIKKIKVAVGSYVIADMVAKAAKTHAGHEFDEYVEIVKIVKKKFTETPDQ